MAHFRRAVPVLPVADLASALDRYGRLGFTTHVRDDGYAYVARDEVRVHLVAHDAPRTGPEPTCYLFVDDADEVADEWRASGVDGELTGPVDTDTGMREGAYVDPDGNVVRFGSPIPTTRQLRVIISDPDT